MINLLVLIARGELEVEVVTAKGDLVTVGPTIKERQAAAESVLDRIAGKAPAIVGIETTNAPEGQRNALEGQSIEVLTMASQLFAKMLAPKEEEAVDVVVEAPALPAHKAE